MAVGVIYFSSEKKGQGNIDVIFLEEFLNFVFVMVVENSDRNQD